MGGGKRCKKRASVDENIFSIFKKQKTEVFEKALMCNGPENRCVIFDFLTTDSHKGLYFKVAHPKVQCNPEIFNCSATPINVCRQKRSFFRKF